MEMKEKSVKEGDWYDWYLFKYKNWGKNEGDKTARTGIITS